MCFPLRLRAGSAAELTDLDELTCAFGVGVGSEEHSLKTLFLFKNEITIETSEIIFRVHLFEVNDGCVVSLPLASLPNMTL